MRSDVRRAVLIFAACMVVLLVASLYGCLSGTWNGAWDVAV